MKTQFLQEILKILIIMYEKKIESWAIFRRGPFLVNPCQLWPCLSTPLLHKGVHFQQTETHPMCATLKNENEALPFYKKILRLSFYRIWRLLIF